MKRCFLAALALLALAFAGYSQTLHDPYDPLYRDLDMWATRGYIASLPPIRPYPPQMVDELLAAVIDRGDAGSAIKARAYLEALGRNRVTAAGQAGLLGEDGDVTPLLRAALGGTFRPEEWMAVSLCFDAWAGKRPVGSEIEVPGVYSPYPDMVNDTSNIGPFIVLQDWNSIMSLGNAQVYFQAGLNRGSFGPFFDNGIVLGPQAGHAGHFSAVYRGKGWTASMLYLALSASNQFGTDRFPNKHMVTHSFDFTVAPGLELGVFESVVYGNRFEMIYMAPFNFLFQAQGIAGFYDNSLLGLQGTWAIQPGLKAMGQVYVDDMGFNDIAKFHLDTKYKFAAEAGMAWAPAGGPLASLEADYTAIMPYMYTHMGDLTKDDFLLASDAKPMYSNYTHMGRPLGADLLPNSDRLSVRTLWDFIPFTRLKLGAEFIHHGNASANYYETPDTTFNNGDWLDDGHDDDGNATFQDTTRFLTQSVIETTLRFALGAEFFLPTAIGSFGLDADCVFEFGWNRGLVEGDDGVRVLYSIRGTWKL